MPDNRAGECSVTEDVQLKFWDEKIWLIQRGLLWPAVAWWPSNAYRVAGRVRKVRSERSEISHGQTGPRKVDVRVREVRSERSQIRHGQTGPRKVDVPDSLPALSHTGVTQHTTLPPTPRMQYDEEQVVKIENR